MRPFTKELYVWADEKTGLVVKMHNSSDEIVVLEGITNIK
jgi:hypothetical protein